MAAPTRQPGSSRRRLPSTQRTLSDWIARDSIRSGLAERELREAIEAGAEIPGLPTRFVTEDLLRALDRRTDGGSDTIPPWLQSASIIARAELAVWRPARGFLPADAGDDADPGEPDDDERARYAATHGATTFPRAADQTAEWFTADRRLIEWLKCRADLAYFLDNYAQVFTKDAGVIPFRLWAWQAWLLDRWCAHTRNITLKGRQLGLSELALGLATWLIVFYAGQQVLFVSIGDREAKALLARVRTILSHLPAWLLPGAPEHPAAASFGKANESELQIVHRDTRGAPYLSGISSLPSSGRIGRSFVATLLVLDEWAHQEYADAIYTAAKDAVGGGGSIIGLSTANGVGNLFHLMWQYAVSPEGAGDYWPIFLSWRRHPGRDDAWYERERQEKIALNQEHLLHQEHPSTALEAFVQSGHNVFANDYLAAHEARIRAEERERAAAGLPRWEASDGLTVFEPPQPGHRYVLGADCAEGKADGDYDAALVINRESGVQVAELRGHFGPEVYAGYLDQLGYYYGSPDHPTLLVVERNNHGHAVLLALTSGLAHERWSGERVPYRRLYHRNVRNNPLDPAARDDRAPGWVTDARTKPLAIDTLALWLREGLFAPRSLALLREAGVFARDERGAMGAPSGFHDDLVMAAALAVFVIAQPNEPEDRLELLARYKALVETRAQEALPAGVTQKAPHPGDVAARLRTLRSAVSAVSAVSAAVSPSASPSTPASTSEG